MKNNNDGFTLSTLIIFIILTAINPFIGIVYMWIHYKIEESPTIQNVGHRLFVIIALAALVFVPFYMLITIIIHGFDYAWTEYPKEMIVIIIESVFFSIIALMRYSYVKQQRKEENNKIDSQE